MTINRPKVIVVNSASIDGRIAITEENLLLYGDERWAEIEGEKDFNLFEHLKTIHTPEATLEGSGSFVREGDEPAPLSEIEGDADALLDDFLPAAVVDRPGHKGWFTVVDGRGRIRWMFKEYPDQAWAGWHALVLVCDQTPNAYLNYLKNEQIPYLVAGTTGVDLGLALEKMKLKLGVTTVLSTAGGRLNGALLRQGLVDEINIEFLPAVIGGFRTPSLFTSPEIKAGEGPIQLKLSTCQAQNDGRVWLQYQVLSPSDNL